MSKLSLQSQTIEKKKLYDMLYDEVLYINDENIQGEFYVDTNEELDKAALNYLMDNSIIEDEDDANFKLKWSGKGLYCFWGLGFGSDYSVAHIEEIFKAETDFDPLVFLGDSEKIEMERQKFYQDASYVYVV
ncbi:hypothetical protein GLV94_19535 [Virgibacillus halodenitrificans]|uniref:hypothetical protein n=1 Tax=Virgibacillus halodenitrificans TaxID=1482 RepID=UPI00136FE9EF|nr:hypothetical protein [Virgibacillus halodenitrificans]MYL47833.1 hypothetical protein [Virgibacillus halodenitrificans]